MPKQHLPILKICSCPCQAGPNVPGHFLAGSSGKQGIAAENAGQTRAAAAAGESEGEFWRFNQQETPISYTLKKISLETKKFLYRTSMYGT